MLPGPLLFLDVVIHLVPLPLSSGMATQPLLAELQGPLILRNLQQFNASFFISRVAGDFSNNFSDVLGFFGVSAFQSALVVFVTGGFGDFVAFVGAGDELMSYSHFWVVFGDCFRGENNLK